MDLRKRKPETAIHWATVESCMWFAQEIFRESTVATTLIHLHGKGGVVSHESETGHLLLDRVIMMGRHSRDPTYEADLQLVFSPPVERLE